MSDFSEYLDEYMEENSISTADLSYEMGIDRTVIHRYRKGKRFPAQEELVEQIADALRMSVLERDKLIDKYDRVKLGEHVVNSYQYVSLLLEKMDNVGAMEKSAMARIYSPRVITLKEKIQMLTGEDQITAYISNLFADVVENNQTEDCLYLAMQPVYESVQKMAQNFFRGSNIAIEQLICLEKNIAKSYKNLEIFHWILPLCIEELNCEILYYYDSLNHHINTMSWFPNTIIYGEYVIQFDYEMKHGVLICDRGYSDIQRTQFIEMKRKSRSLFRNGFKQTKHEKRIQMFSAMDIESGGTLFQQPCMALGICSHIYREFLYDFPEKENFIQIMTQKRGDWEDMKYVPVSNMEPGKVVSYCKLEGIRQFMETGRLDEFPEDFYRPLDMEARRKVLQRCIQLVRNKVLTFYFLPEEIMLPPNTYFYWDDMEKFSYMNYLGEDGVVQMAINEKGIYWAFQHFIEYLKEKNMLIKEEEVLQELEKIRKDYW